MMDPERLAAAGLGSQAELVARLYGTDAIFNQQQMPQQSGDMPPAFEQSGSALRPRTTSMSNEAHPGFEPGNQPRGGQPQGGGGFLSGISDWLSGGKRQKVNQTVNWLQQQGLDEGTARGLAANPPLLQHYLKQYVDARDPRNQLEFEKTQLEVENLRNPRMSPYESSRLGLDERKFDFERSNAEKTNDIREYQQAKREGYEGDFRTWQMEMKQAGATTINNNMAAEKAWDTESAKLWAKRYDDITAGAMNSQQMLGMYDLAEQAFDSGVRTGFGAETELTLRQLGAAMGLDTDPAKLAGGELIRSVQNRMALMMRSPDGGMGMPGALSDRDIKFLKDSQIGIDRSPEGNKRMLQAYRLMEQRKIEIARIADEYVQQNGRLDAGFNSYLRDYANANPLFETATNDAPRQIMDVEDYKRLPSGTQFIAPDGTVRRKP
ncbi:MAG: hypothetical protein KL840_21810 [Aquamicrobium sp.]|nr:hypothetical protein [Aquamicrobium sp.]